MRVLMGNSFYYMRGGAERYVFELTRLLAAHGHEIIPFAMQHENNFPSDYSRYFVSKIDYPSFMRQKTSFSAKIKMVERLLYSPETKEKVEQLAGDTKPQVAHLHGIGHEMSSSILAGIKKRGVPVVQTLHDYGMLCPNSCFISQGEICEKCKTHRYYQVVLRRCKRNSTSASLLAALEKYFTYIFSTYERNVDVYIVPSSYLKNKLIEYGVKKKIIQIPNFVDIDRFTPCYEPSNYYVFVGRLDRIKGLFTLLNAVKSIPSAQLLIAGDGELKSALEEFVQQNQLQNVKFLGHLATPDLVKVVQGSAFTVFPSECYENYPMTIIESYACGKPVIASRLGAMPDLVEDGSSGLLFEPKNPSDLAEKIQSLLDRPSKTLEMGRNARRIAETTNSPEIHYQRILEVYQDLLH